MAAQTASLAVPLLRELLREASSDASREGKTMREISVRVSDDLDFTRDGIKNDAAVTLAIGLDGTWKELDLTEHNEKLVRDILDELMAAGHDPEEEVKPPSARRNKFGPNPEKAAFNQRLREWVRNTGLKNKTGTGWAYQTNTTLEDYIGEPLVRRYQAYLDQTGNKEERER